MRQTFAAMVCLFAVSCGSPQQPEAGRTRAPVSVAKAPPPGIAGGFDALPLASVEPGTYGPLAVSLAEGGLAVWASPSDTARLLRVTVLDPSGRSNGEVFTIGQCEAVLGLMTLRAVESDKSALLVYATQPEEQSTVLRATLLDAKGHQRTSPIELLRTSASLLWMEVIDTKSGPMVFFATGRDNHAEIRAVGLSPSGAIRFADREVASEVRAWQVVKASSGAALSVLALDGQSGTGKVQLLLLDDQAALMGTPAELANDAKAELDLDLTQVGDNFVLAWSARSRIDSQVMLAAVNQKGQVVTPPTLATPPMGEQALVKLVPEGALGHGALLWEELNRPSDRRRLSLAELDDQGKLASEVISLPSSAQSNQAPEIVATKDGWAILTLDDGPFGSEEHEPKAYFIELDSGLSPRGAAELKFSTTKGKSIEPLLAYGLDCRHGCRATVAFNGEPVQIRSAILRDTNVRDPNATRAKALMPRADARLPRLEQLETLAEVEPLADMSVTRDDTRHYLSYLTYFDPSTPLTRLTKPGPDGRTDALQARLDTITLSDSLSPEARSTISFRATSQPGVSIAHNRADGGARALAWSALEKGQPQLYLTQLGEDGSKRAQRVLTHRSGALDEVTVVPAADGWFAGWIDERNVLPEAYVVRVTKTLERRGSEQRISQGQGQVTAIALLPQEGHLLLVWAEARVSAQKRRVELYARRLSLVDGQPLAPSQRLLEIPGALKFLSATKYGQGAVLSWLEVISDGNSVDAKGRVRFLRLDENGVASGPTSGLDDSAGAPVSVTLDCAERECHGVVTRDLGGRGELAAFTFNPEAARVPEVIAAVRSLGTVEQNVAPVLLGEHLFAVDQIDAERVRILHAKFRWK